VGSFNLHLLDAAQQSESKLVFEAEQAVAAITEAQYDVLLRRSPARRAVAQPNGLKEGRLLRRSRPARRRRDPFVVAPATPLLRCARRSVQRRGAITPAAPLQPINEPAQDRRVFGTGALHAPRSRQAKARMRERA
jgi:hypothetical protein